MQLSRCIAYWRWIIALGLGPGAVETLRQGRRPFGGTKQSGCLKICHTRYVAPPPSCCARHFTCTFLLPLTLFSVHVINLCPRVFPTLDLCGSRADNLSPLGGGNLPQTVTQSSHFAPTPHDCEPKKCRLSPFSPQCLLNGAKLPLQTVLSIVISFPPSLGLFLMQVNSLQCVLNPFLTSVKRYNDFLPLLSLHIKGSQAVSDLEFWVLLSCWVSPNNRRIC